MKQNDPVSGKERRVPPGEVLVSKTDLRGVITYANSTFAELSGYRVDELVGKSHNLVRHPDVPPQVFEDMWATLKRGQPWRGIVKNRARNGDHYWVESFVMPIMADGKTTGYQSVRRRARCEDVMAAEKHYQEIHGGKIVLCPRRIRMSKLLSIRSGFMLGIAYVAAMLLAGALAGLGIMRQAEGDLKKLYENKVLAGDSLARIKFLMADNRAQIMLSLLHDPANPLSAMHDHPISRHTDAISQSRDEIERLWASFRMDGMRPETAMLAERYWTVRSRYVMDGLEPAIQALDSGNFREANRLLGVHTNRLYEEANTLADALMQSLRSDVEARHALAMQHHEQNQRTVVVSMVLALAALAICGFLFFRGIVSPLDKGITSLIRIARGDLSGAVDIGGGGEVGRFNCALAMTQAQLLVMSDEIANGVSRVSSECGMLNSTVQSISDSIDEEHQRIYQVADRLAESAQDMKRLSLQAEEVFHSAGQSVAMAQAAGREFSELLLGTMIVADAVFLFREQLEKAGGVLEYLLASAKVDEAAVPEVVAVVEEIRKVETSLAALGRRIEQDKPWEKAQGSAKDKVEEIGGRLAEMARELATETRIQSFASEDAQHEMGKVAMFLVENREAMHALWLVSSKLAELAASLEKTVAEFEIG
jgi:aerotaxis receptor